MGGATIALAGYIEVIACDSERVCQCSCSPSERSMSPVSQLQPESSPHRSHHHPIRDRSLLQELPPLVVRVMSP